MRTIATLALIFALSPVAEAVPMNFQHQGRMLDSSGVPLDGSMLLTFRLYDASAGGSAVWQEPHTNVDFVNGYYNVMLGSVVDLESTDFDGDSLYMTVQVAAGAELTDRVELVSVPYAILAESAETVADGAAINASSIKVNDVTIIDSSGKIDASALVGVSDTLMDIGCATGQIAQKTTSGWGCIDNTHSAADITGGIIDMARLPTGTSLNTIAFGEHDHSDLAVDLSDFDGITRACPSGFGEQTYDGSAGSWSACATSWNCVDTPTHAGCDAGGSDGTYSSCQDIVDDSTFNGSGAAHDLTYWIDPDGGGGLAPIRAYCDMTTQGGGWTQVMNIDTSDGNYVHFNQTAFWTEAGSSQGNVNNNMSADYKAAEVFANVQGTSIMIRVHEEGVMLAYRAWNMPARSMNQVFGLGGSTIFTTGSFASSNASSLDQYEGVVRPTGELYANRTYGYSTSTDESRIVNVNSPGLASANNGDDSITGIGLWMNVSNGTRGSRWDAGYGWDGGGYTKALMGSDEEQPDPWGTSNSRGLNYDYAIFVRE